MTVLTLLRADDIAANREVLCEWLKANSIDPVTAADRWISVEEADSGALVIRYQRYKLNSTGRRLLDPNDDARPWVEELTTLQVVALPALPAGALADGHGS